MPNSNPFKQHSLTSMSPGKTSSAAALGATGSPKSLDSGLALGPKISSPPPSLKLPRLGRNQGSGLSLNPKSSSKLGRGGAAMRKL